MLVLQLVLLHDHTTTKDVHEAHIAAHVAAAAERRSNSPKFGEQKLLTEALTSKSADIAAIVAHSQHDARIKEAQSKEQVPKMAFRQWESLDDLFEDLGAHPLAQSEIYDKRVVRILGNRDLKRGPSLVTTANAFCGMKVRRGPNWQWGQQDGGGAGKDAIGIMRTKRTKRKSVSHS